MSFPSRRATLGSAAARPSRLRHWLPAFVWLLTVAFFSSRSLGAENTGSILAQLLAWLNIKITPLGFQALHYFIRKCAHFTAYGILSALFFRAFRGSDLAANIWKARYALFALAICLVTASSDEIHQTFTPGRTGNWHDVALDMIGATFVQCAIMFATQTRWARMRWSARENIGNASSSNPAVTARPAER